MSEKRTYIAIDLKSFYASVECMERGLNPLTTNLVVADPSRTEKTICLAVSPSLKAYGISGRARLFEVIQKVNLVNAERKKVCGKREGESFSSVELEQHPEYAVSYLTAVPRMSLYIDYSTRIYNVYLRYVAPEDIHVYSIDEVFMDVTDYLAIYKMTPHELAKDMIKAVLTETGITATAGIGTNLYLCKIAMDIVAKHVEPDEDGVRIAELEEMSYRKQLWNHRPLTDFWRVGKGYARKLEQHGIFTMGDIARCSMENEELLYKLFGVNAELLIDHAWGWEPCTMKMIKEYKPETNSFSSGQVLQSPYSFEKARLVVHEMSESIALDLVEKKMVTDQLVLTVNFDRESLKNPDIKCEITTDGYGRKIPKHAHGTTSLKQYSSSTKMICDAVLNLYDAIVDPKLLIRKIHITTNHVIKESEKPEYYQMDLFSDFGMIKGQKEEQDERERRLQETMLGIKKKFGKNAILKGMDLQEGATARERNNQVGGHRK